MRIFTNCANCDSQISLWTWDSDRVRLRMKHGSLIELKCKKCNVISKYEINDLKAKESKMALLVAVIIFVVGTPVILALLWNSIWKFGLYSAAGLIAIIGIPIMIFGIINRSETNRVSTFNNS
jgi:hypothetical protein